MDWYKTAACDEIDKKSNDLFKFSNRIWKSTHSRDKRLKNIDCITKYLKKNDFHIDYDLQGMPNTFRAWYGVDSSPGNKRVNVAYLCRYDVDGKPSQFSGNHLVAEAAVAAALGVKAVLKLSCPTIGRVTVIGCPDTLDGGVATLVNLRVFKNVDVVMMAFPGPRTDWYPRFLGRKTFQATYNRGPTSKPPKPVSTACGAIYPDQAVQSAQSEQKVPPCDEQDVCMIAYQNVLAMQEHFAKGWRMTASFGRTGLKNKCRTVVCTSAPSNPELYFLEKRIIPCLEAAAHASGCEIEIHLAQKTYYSFINNMQMCYLLQMNAYHCGTLATPLVKSRPIMEPIDVGNVSHVVPTLMPMFYVGTDADTKSEEFKKSLRSPTAQAYTVAIAKAIAMTAVDLLVNPGSIAKVKDELADSLKEEKASSTFKEFLGLPGIDLVKMPLPFEGNVGWSKVA